MKSQQKIKIIGVAILLQLLIILGLFARAWYPLWIGTEVRVKTVPVDPRSLFRGNYARLSYDFTRVPVSACVGEIPKRGEEIFTQLERRPDGLFERVSASKTQPKDGVFIRGIVKTDYSDVLTVNYGIDAYFAPKKKALKMEADLRKGGIAILKVAPSGRAAISEIVPNPANR